MLVEFAQDMFPGISTEDIGVCSADDDRARSAICAQVLALDHG
jgi:hypothetical protein